MSVKRPRKERQHYLHTRAIYIIEINVYMYKVVTINYIHLWSSGSLEQYDLEQTLSGGPLKV